VNVELNHAESELQSDEASLHAELTRLAQVSAELSTRLEALRTQAAEAGAQDIARRSQVAPPAIHPDASFAQAVAARQAAVQARQQANAAARSQAQAVKAQLQKLAQQVLADEKAVQAAAAAAEQARTLVSAPAPVSPPPAAKAPPPARPQAAAAGAPRRASPRVRMQASVDFQSDDNFFNGFSANISDGGLFVATVNLLPLGTEVDLAFTLPTGERIETKGTVQWVREVNDKHPEVFPGMGVSFRGLSDQAQQVINEFVAQREPLFYAAE
jgi:uncharacterized protein (TIGR02266 family)